MEYNTTTKSLQVVIKLFADDLELVLEKENDTKVDLGLENQTSDLSKMISSYLSKHFIIEQDKGSIRFSYVGEEIDKDYVWVYIEYENFKFQEESLLTNTLLISYFPEQTNKVNYKNGKLTSSFTLHKDNRVEEF